MNRCLSLYRACLCLSAITLIGCGSSAKFVPPGAENSSNTVTPIHHVVIVIGENRSFDNLFATYQPPAQGQSIFNLLSEGIVNTDGSPGPNFQQAAQQQAIDTPADEFMLSPSQTGSFTTLPQPSMGLNLLLLPYSLEYGILSEPGLSEQDQQLLHQGGFFGRFSPDPRLSAATNNGPYEITSFSYDFNLLNYQPGYRKLNTKDNTGDPMHRFYQNWQQSDCNVAHATKSNPSGCLHDLYTWVAAVRTRQNSDLNGVERIVAWLQVSSRHAWRTGKMESWYALGPDYGFAAHNGNPILGGKANDRCAARANAGHRESRAQVRY